MTSILHSPFACEVLERFLGYRKGKEPLTSMAYFGATFLEYMVDPES